MGIGIGVYCKICGEQLTSLSTIDEEQNKICSECSTTIVSFKDKMEKADEDGIIVITDREAFNKLFE